MKFVGFILALTVTAASANEAVIATAGTGPDAGARHWQAGEPAYLMPSTPAAKLEARLDEVTRKLDADLQQRLSERVAARYATDGLVVSTYSQ